MNRHPLHHTPIAPPNTLPSRIYPPPHPPSQPHDSSTGTGWRAAHQVWADQGRGAAHREAHGALRSYGLCLFCLAEALGWPCYGF